MFSCSQKSLEAVDAVLTKFLKFYLGVPVFSNNAITHFITGTVPLSVQLHQMAPHCTGGLAFPPSLHGLQLSFLSANKDCMPYSPVSLIPPYFWHSKVVLSIPFNFHMRKAICRDVFDVVHFDLCSNKQFHVKPSADCICILCGSIAHFYHKYDCVHIVQS